MAGTGNEHDDEWHRREYVRRLHLNRERGLASGPVPTVEEIRKRERGPISEWLRPRQPPRARRRQRWKDVVLVAASVALGIAALALKFGLLDSPGRMPEQQAREATDP